jgi:hypothetical protein
MASEVASTLDKTIMAMTNRPARSSVTAVALAIVRMVSAMALHVVDVRRTLPMGHGYLL